MRHLHAQFGLNQSRESQLVPVKEVDPRPPIPMLQPRRGVEDGVRRRRRGESEGGEDRRRRLSVRLIDLSLVDRL